MKTAVAQRVVVMGREGQARDQLISALAELGMMPIWVGKPVQSNPEQLSELNPNRVIVSLEPSIELELEPYSDFLSQPSVMVLYDDAEITRELSGWDLQRWARHLAAKLLEKDAMPASYAPAVAEVDDAGQTLAESLPDWNELPSAAAAGQNTESEEFSVAAWQNADNDNYEVLDIDSDELSAALEKLNQTLSEGYEKESVHALAAPRIELSTAAGTGPSADLLEFESLPVIELGPDDAEPDDVALDFAPIDVDLTDTLADPTETVPDATPAQVKRPLLSSESLELQSEDDYESFVSEMTSQSDLIPDFDLSKYSLVPEETGASDSDGAADASDKRSAKSLFLVISGQGGLAALRTLLSQISPGFSGILAIAHDIETVQLGKLRDQFQKITPVPIVVLGSDEFLKTGAIYLLPPKHSLVSTSLGYQCIRAVSLAGYIDQMDHNAEILILSGADAQLAQQLIQVSSLIHNIHVQSPEDCFEPTLAQILVNVGAPVLSQDVTEQWFN
jgi:chemosensory pili system protein ChpB (putative protein-glutamate methylesterase)